MSTARRLTRWANWLVWLPGIIVLALYFSNQLTFNPIRDLLHWAGRFAVGFFVLSLMITPLITITGLSLLAGLRRPIGLAAFYYAILHLTIFIALDQQFNWQELWKALITQPYIWLGAAGLVILVILGVSAHKKIMRKLGKRWKSLQRLAYIGIFVVLVHYAMARKGNIFTLQGDIAIPLILLGITILFLLLRLPVLRRAIIRLRKARG